jgi:diadenosine tetraphosphate (Ap4A) HIT family hydrolase
MVTNLTVIDCELCNSAGGEVIWRDEFARVVRVPDEKLPGFCRVILERHVKEMSDLSMDARERLMLIVYSVEQALRDLLLPDKINLASFGNAVPHLHWHVIPRWRDDACFPNPVWAAPAREGPATDIQAARHAAANSDAFMARLREVLP